MEEQFKSLWNHEQTTFDRFNFSTAYADWRLKLNQYIYYIHYLYRRDYIDCARNIWNN